MARLVGVKPPTVHQWVTADRPIPAERCPDIERATNGTVTCEELRPDLADQWQYLRATRSPAGKPRPLHRYTQGSNTARQTDAAESTAELAAIDAAGRDDGLRTGAESVG